MNPLAAGDPQKRRSSDLFVEAPPSLTDKKYLYSGTCVFASIRRGRKVPNQVPRVPSFLAGVCLRRGKKNVAPTNKAVCLT